MKLPNRYLIAAAVGAVVVVVGSTVAFASWASGGGHVAFDLRHTAVASAVPQPSTSSVRLVPAPDPFFGASPAASPQAVTPTPGPTYKGPPWSVFLGRSPADPRAHVVSIVGLEGVTLARAQGADRSQSVSGTTQLPVVSTSKARVYYLDGDSLVKFLTPNGTTGTAAQIPGSATVHAVFAVSPDDQQIAVSTIDYGAKPPHLRLYVENLDGSHHTELSASSSEYVWPVGWHGGDLVLAVGEAYPATDNHIGSDYQYCDQTRGPCTSDNPYSATHGYRLVDPVHGTLAATLAPGACTVIGLLTPAGSLCREGKGVSGLITQTEVCRVDLTICLRQVDWSGAITDWTTIATVWTGVMAGDGSGVAACCNVNAINLYPPRRVGGEPRQLTTAAWPLAFMDASDLVYRAFSSQETHLLDLDGGHDVAVNAPGVPVAALPGGF